MKGLLRAPILVVLVCGLTGTSSARTACSAGSTAVTGPAINLTPLTLRILDPSLTPVAATDGLTHLSYAAEVSNLQDASVTVDSVAPVDPAKGYTDTGRNQPVDRDGKAITGKVRLFGIPATAGQSDGARYSSTVPAGGFGVMFFDVAYKDGDAVPAQLSHRIAITNTKTGVRTVGLTDPITVNCDEPVVLRPPLVGHGWWDGNGCCETVNAHRGATLPANGDLKSPEQFAIDFVQLRKGGGCCTGQVKDLKSWSFFGTPVLAAAAGKVVEVETGMPEQVPGPPVGVTASNAAGNHIIQDIGNGRFILYAHLRLGSIPSGIKPGVMLTAGQTIGQVGNTGSSAVPHLHFQVMDRPSTLNAIGLPFVFDTQTPEGRVKDTPAEADDRYEGGGQLTVEPAEPKTVHGLMPAEGQVFGFNLK